METNYFAFIPVEVIQDKRLTFEQTRVLIALFSFRGKNTNTVWPSREAISQRCRMHISNISKATKALEDLGWLIKVGTGGFSKSTRYTIEVPEKIVAESATVAQSATQTVAESATSTVAQSARGKELTSELTSELTNIEARQSDRSKKTKVGRPSDVDEQIWEDWLQLRKTKKAPVTQTAIDGISREAMKAGYTLEQALEACCSNGWQGFKAEWVNKPITQQRASNQMQMKSFAQQERERGWLQWEEMTGREHEEMRKIRQAEGLVYMPPDRYKDQNNFLLGDES